MREMVECSQETIVAAELFAVKVFKWKTLKLKTKTEWKNVLSLQAEIFLPRLLSNSTTHFRRKRNLTSESSEKFPNSTDKIELTTLRVLDRTL